MHLKSWPQKMEISSSAKQNKKSIKVLSYLTQQSMSKHHDDDVLALYGYEWNGWMIIL